MIQISEKLKTAKLKILFFFALLNIIFYPYPVLASQFTGTARAIVAIGSTPTQCPQGWPTSHGYITQGPQGTTDHFRLYPSEQAIDVGGNPIDTPTFATFSGTVLIVNSDYTPGVGYGKYVDIQGSCNGTTFTARWAHLDFIDGQIVAGNPVNIGQQIGGIDSTGHSTGTHLHYSFFGLTMGTPYIPQNPSSPSCDSDNGTACGIFW